MRQNASNYPGRKKVVLAVFLVMWLLFTWSLARNLVSLMSLGGRLEDVKEEVVSLEKENYTLQNQIVESKTEDFGERKIREKLGMVKEGETVVIIPDNLIELQEKDVIEGKRQVAEKESIFGAWKSLFF